MAANKSSGTKASGSSKIPTYSASNLVKLCRDNVGKVVGDGTERGLATFLLNKAGAAEAVGGQWSSQIIPTIEAAEPGDVIQIENSQVAWVEDHDIRKGEHSALRKLYPRPQMLALGNPGSTLIVLGNKEKGSNVEIYSQNFSGLAPACATFVDFKAANNQIGAMWIYRPVQRQEKGRIVDGKGPQITPLSMGEAVDPKIRAHRANRLRALIKFLDASMSDITDYIDAKGARKLTNHMVAEYDRDFNSTITKTEKAAIASDLNDMFGATLFNGDLSEIRASLGANVDSADGGEGSADGSGGSASAADLSDASFSDDSHGGRKKLGHAVSASSGSGSFSIGDGGASASGSASGDELTMDQTTVWIRKYLYKMFKYHEFCKQACVLKLALCDDKWIETIVKGAFEDAGIDMEKSEKKATKVSGREVTYGLPIKGKTMRALAHAMSSIKSETGWESDEIYAKAIAKAAPKGQSDLKSREFLMVLRMAIRLVLRQLLAQGMRPNVKRTGASRTVRMKIRDKDGNEIAEVDVELKDGESVEISDSASESG